jgi:hypothetical protein
LALLIANTSTPRPPLNIFEASRKRLPGDDWVEIARVPRYFVPAVGPIQEKFVNAVAIMTGIVITNVHDETIQASVRIRGIDGVNYIVIDSAPIPKNDFLSVGLERQVMMTGEVLEIQIPSNDQGNDTHAHVHFSYIINQREEFVYNNDPNP